MRKVSGGREREHSPLLSDQDSGLVSSESCMDKEEGELSDEGEMMPMV